jgi:gamma-glutamylcyclotransferase (GGCT)/AIG2-like uncharacterized protein YtfP
MKLFVYGTLKRGQSRAAVLDGQEFLARAWTAGDYRMYDCGGYPGLVASSPGVAVEGELWDVDSDCLRTLDEIEGTSNNLYQRRVVVLQPPLDRDDVLTYFYQRSVAGLVDCGSCW